jgi:hypothetical protein
MTTQPKQYQNEILKSQKETKSIPPTHKYMTVHFPSLVQAFQEKVAGLS